MSFIETLSVHMSIQIPTWAKKLGKAGLVVFVIYVFLKIVIDTIFKLEIENWWTSLAKPWLGSKESVNFDLFGWQILLFALIFITLIFVIPIFFIFKDKKVSLIEQIKYEKAPQVSGDANLNTSDIVSAVVSTRKGKMKPEDLAELIVSALNSSLISRETATKTLKEFDYSLIYLGGDHYTFNKLGVDNEQKLYDN